MSLHEIRAWHWGSEIGLAYKLFPGFGRSFHHMDWNRGWIEFGWLDFLSIFRFELRSLHLQILSVYRGKEI